MTLIDTYKNQLDLVRQNFELLRNYKFDIESNDAKHFARLRLNIALYNDLMQSDYEIARFLFEEEIKWCKDEKDGKDGDVDNLYFSAFILTHFGNPEIIWLFLDTKTTDFDLGLGFDTEFLLATGIEFTYKYLESLDQDQARKESVLQLIGPTRQSCPFSLEDIDSWKEFKNRYFRIYKYPIEDELAFLYSTNERDIFLTKFKPWIEQPREWTYDELASYRTYAKYFGNKEVEIEAYELTLRKNDKEFLINIYQRELAALYIDIVDLDKGYELLKETIKRTGNHNIVSGCVEQLCRIILSPHDDPINELKREVFILIKSAQRKYKRFSPHVDDLIHKVDESFGHK